VSRGEVLRVNRPEATGGKALVESNITWSNSGNYGRGE